MMLLQTPETVEKVFAAKVRGTVVLDELLKDEAARLHGLLLLEALVLRKCRSLRLLGGEQVHGRVRRPSRQARARNRHGDQLGHMAGSRHGRASRRRPGARSASARPRDDDARKASTCFSGFSTAELPQAAVSLHGLAPDASRAEVESPSDSGPAADDSHAPASHPRPEIEPDYEAPRTDVERTLARIWQDVSGIAPIGIKDNFFELGGDSVIALQIVAKANQAGLKLTPRHVLEHQTIAELAAVVGTGTPLEPEQGIVTGPVPLTPVQRWFFERDPPEPHHFNQSVLLEELQPIDHALFQRSIRHLIEHHDALRLRYARDGSGWRQSSPIQTRSTNRPDRFVQRGARPSNEPRSRPRRQTSSAGLNLFKGPVLRVAHFDLGPDQHGRWLLIIHHLAVDVVSWGFLLEDLQAAYQALSEGRTFSLPRPAVSFKQWSERLTSMPTRRR